MWRYVQWAPTAVLAILFALSAVYGGIESVVVVALVTLQVLVLVLPFLTRFLGRAIGRARS